MYKYPLIWAGTPISCNKVVISVSKSTFFIAKLIGDVRDNVSFEFLNH